MVTSKFAWNTDGKRNRSDVAILQDIILSPPSAILERFETQKFTAIGYYSDSSQEDITPLLDWISLDTFVGDFIEPGIFRAKEVGVTLIEAGLHDISAQAQVTVSKPTLISLYVSPSRAELELNETQLFQAKGTFSDGLILDITPQVYCSSRQLY